MKKQKKNKTNWVRITLNEGYKWDDKLFGIGFAIWTRPLELEINLLFWTLWIGR